MDYVSLLLQTGNKDAALQVLDEGVRYYYPHMPELVPFYALTARLRREAGREEEARELEQKAKWLEHLIAPRYQLRS
jgi:hypothetical protein